MAAKRATQKLTHYPAFSRLDTWVAGGVLWTGRMPTFVARRLDREVEPPARTFISGELPLFVGGQVNVESGDVTVTCPNCNAVLLDSVKLERFLGIVFVCPRCNVRCEP
jgi:predicted RNA-binding Zn-ribbon protein involved in translation (DUF1610 family)